MPDEVRTTIESYDKIASDYCRHTLRDEFRRIEEDFLERFLRLMGPIHARDLGRRSAGSKGASLGVGSLRREKGGAGWTS